MPDTSIILMVALEAGIAVLFLLGLVLLRARHLSKTSAALEAKVIELRQTLKGVRTELKTVRAEAENAQKELPDYAEFYDAQISATRNHHLELNPERDIVLDMAADTPLERRTASLRHAFLIAEKEAWLASESGREVDWSVLQGKLGQIIEFYEQPVAALGGELFPDADGLEALDLDSGEPLPADSEQSALQEIIDNQKRHIENLERFKRLFFDADEKWHTASLQAEQYRQELIEKSRKFNAGDEFDVVLAKYSQVYNDFGATLAADKEPTRAAEPARESGVEARNVGRVIIANQEEVQRLRNMAVDQHKMILRLRQELESAQSVEEKDRMIGELHKQLERHERFLKESDICTKQLETELERVLEENHALKMKVIQIKQEEVAPDFDANPDSEQMANIIQDFTRQSSEMLNALEQLEAECSELRRQVTGGASKDTSQTEEQIKQQLALAQQELLNLQTQHIELEERYLELKTRSL